jgi:hypothetical protein
MNKIHPLKNIEDISIKINEPNLTHVNTISCYKNVT